MTVSASLSLSFNADVRVTEDARTGRTKDDDRAIRSIGDRVSLYDSIAAGQGYAISPINRTDQPRSARCR